MKIGSHVSLSAPDYLLGSLKEALSYNANALMLYTGAPQNTKRKELSDEQINAFHQEMAKNQIPLANVIIHAPYIINLANTIKSETFELATSFLTKEINRVKRLKANIIVLHPGSHVNAGTQAGLDQIVNGLNIALKDAEMENSDIVIALETMAGKGSECGRNFEELAYIINHCEYKDYLRVCMDTCHIHDAGYDLNHFDDVLDEFDRIIGLERLVCIHINDSKNSKGAKKDRHANIGFGEIGYENLAYIVHHPKLQHIVKILETPYVNGFAPYKNEIKMLLDNQFDEHVLDEYQK